MSPVNAAWIIGLVLLMVFAFWIGAVAGAPRKSRRMSRYWFLFLIVVAGTVVALTVASLWAKLIALAVIIVATVLTD